MNKKNNNSAYPRYKLIYNNLREKILSDKLKDGTMIPSENILAHENSVSRVTVRNAINELKRDGLIETIPGLGHRVANPVIRIVELKPILFIGRRDNITPMLFEAVHATAKNNGTDCRMMSYSNKFDGNIVELDEKFIEGIIPSEIGGIVFFSDKATCANLSSHVKMNSIPMICVGYSGNQYFDSVLSDNSNASRILSNEIKFKGHKNIVYASDDYLEKNIESFRTRYAVIKELFRQANNSFNSLNFKHNYPRYDENKNATNKLLELLGNGTTCIIASNALLAGRLRSFITERRVKVPEDVSIVTFISDDNYYSEKGIMKKISGMEENWKEIGTIACEALISKIRSGNNSLPRTILIPMSFCQGDTLSTTNNSRRK